jgi:hypothetical protein
MIQQIIKCKIQTVTNGDGIWGCPSGVVINVKKIVITQDAYEDEGITYDIEYIDVYHNASWEIYTDTALPKLISDYLGKKVDFTEQGMQANKRASMEFST